MQKVIDMAGQLGAIEKRLTKLEAAKIKAPEKTKAPAGEGEKTNDPPQV